MTTGVITGVSHHHEQELVRAVEEASGVAVVRRCADVAELMSTGASGTADVAVVSADFRGLDRDALRHLARERAIVAELTGMVGAQPGELTERIGAMVTRLKEAERELERARKEAVLAAAGSLTEQAKDVGGVRFIGHDAGGDAAADDVRAMVLDARQRLGEGVGGDVDEAIHHVGQFRGEHRELVDDQQQARQRRPGSQQVPQRRPAQRPLPVSHTRS